MVFSVSCDQGTKRWARDALPGHSISVIDGFWDFRLAQNPDGAFSLFHGTPGGRYILTAVGLALLVAMFWWVRRSVNQGWLACAALGLIAGGAIGNLYDRVMFGSVTDFVYWHARSWRWPVFNVADVLLVIGVALMLLAPRPAKPTSASPA
jgi:signal peptidase II